MICVGDKNHKVSTRLVPAQGGSWVGREGEVSVCSSCLGLTCYKHILSFEKIGDGQESCVFMVPLAK